MTAALRRPGGARKPRSDASPDKAASPGAQGTAAGAPGTAKGAQDPARSTQETAPARAPSSRRSPALSPEEREALAWTHTARFYITAAELHQLPAHELPEIAFVGRSNAGKSTAINTLASQRQLAFASKMPGRTQHINLFAVGPKDAPQVLWADLPGYGYAAVARTSKERWQAVMADYLAVRRNLGGVVQMVDARHGFTALDLQLLEYVAPRVRNGEVRLLVLLTKADKLGRKACAEALRAAQGVLGDYASESSDIGVALFSALKGIGVADAALALREWAQVPAGMPVADSGEAPPLTDEGADEGVAAATTPDPGHEAVADD
jgi:GTP-binding protein